MQNSTTAAVVAKHNADNANASINADLDALEASRPSDLLVLRPPHAALDIPEMMLTDFVFESIQNDKVALISPPVEDADGNEVAPERRVTYSELIVAIRACSSGLLARGVKKVARAAYVAITHGTHAARPQLYCCSLLASIPRHMST